MATPWDARTHDVLRRQQAWASDVLARLHRIPGDATVLDVGCGTGRVTGSLHALVPRGSVLAIDASEEMVTLARSRLGDRAQMWCQDVLDLAEAVDVIISTAARHWVSDHDRMWGRLGLALRPGGIRESAVWRPGQHRSCPRAHDRVAQDAFPERVGWSPWVFASSEETERRCARPASARFGAGWKTGQLIPRTSARLSAPRSWRHTSRLARRKAECVRHRRRGRRAPAAGLRAAERLRCSWTRVITSHTATDRRAYAREARAGSAPAPSREY